MAEVVLTWLRSASKPISKTCDYPLTEHRIVKTSPKKDGFVFSVVCSLTYDIKLQPTFDRQEPLITNNEVRKGTIATAYEDYPYFLEAIERIHNVFQGMLQNEGGGGKYLTHQGRRYKIRTGERGGTYILVKNKKTYISQTQHTHQKGGNRVPEDIFKFMYDRFIHRVLQHYDADEFTQVEAKIFYDEENGTHFVLCYDLTEIGNRMMYYLNMQEIILDYTDYTHQKNVQAIEQKYDTLTSSHQQFLAVA